VALVLALVLTWPALYPWSSPVARAAGISVNTTDDELNSDGDCSLREAIQAANTDSAVDACPGGSGADTITLPAGFYILTIPGADEHDNASGDLDIIGDLTINGDGAGTTIIQAGTNASNGIDRVLDIHYSADAVEISGVRIRYGRTPGIRDEEDGGGIRNRSTLTLNNCTVSSNAASGSGGYGGGIRNHGALTLNNSTVAYNTANYWGGGIANDGTLTLNNSTVNGNSAVFAGGIYHMNLSTLTLDNCTVSDNSAEQHGGGIYSSSLLTLRHSTIADNTADSDNNGFGDGGGIYVARGLVNVLNTIIGDNWDRGGEAHDCRGVLNSEGYNLLEQSAGCTVVGDTTGNISGEDPNLGLLAENGGPSRTQALRTGSPAIDRIPKGTNGCQAGVSTDQRGYSRAGGAGYGGSACDMGAYEYGSAPHVNRVYLPIILKNH